MPHPIPTSRDEHVVTQAKLARELGIHVQRQRFVARRPSLTPRDYRIMWAQAIIAAGLAGGAAFGFLDLIAR